MACSVFVKQLDVVDSTNRYVRDNAAALWDEASGFDAVAVVANQQTAGRGQRGNSWLSQPGCNLLLSILVRPGKSLEAASQFLLSQAAAVAVHRAMQSFGIDTRLKWPNDIYAGNRKLAGILVELDCSGEYIEQSIIGVGLNVNQVEFPLMDRIPVSMRMLLGNEVAVDDVLVSVLGSFEHCYRMLLDGEEGTVAEEYGRLLLGLGEERTYIDTSGIFKAVIEGVEPTGALLLRRSGGSLSRYMFKEVEQPM